METRLKNIVRILDEKKALDIETIDLTGKGYISDQVIIATGLNGRHVSSLLVNLKDELIPLGEEFVRTEEDSDWSIIDMGDIIIHVMTSSHREKYNIEELLEGMKKDFQE